MENSVYDTIELAKKAYHHWEIKSSERTPDDFKSMFDLLADDVVFRGSWPDTVPGYGGVFRGKEAVRNLIAVVDSESVSDIDLERPLEFIGSGDKVVVLGSQRYKINKTGTYARNKLFAIVLTFRRGLIAEILQFEDVTEWLDAHRE